MTVARLFRHLRRVNGWRFVVQGGACLGQLRLVRTVARSCENRKSSSSSAVPDEELKFASQSFDQPNPANLVVRALAVQAVQLVKRRVGTNVLLDVLHDRLEVDLASNRDPLASSTVLFFTQVSQRLST